jgi:hypothetical protein
MNKMVVTVASINRSIEIRMWDKAHTGNRHIDEMIILRWIPERLNGNSIELALLYVTELLSFVLTVSWATLVSW